MSIGHVAMPRAAFKIAALAALGLGLAGCSTAIPLPGFISHEDVTGSIAKFSSPLSPKLGPEDSRQAIAALGAALDPASDGSRVDWDNPNTGLNGSFVPVGNVFSRDTRVCRNFLGELGLEEYLQGTGCRTRRGDWAVLDVKPMKKG